MTPKEVVAVERKPGFRKEPLGEVISDGYRVKRLRDGNLGKIERVVSDKRSWCLWNDGTISLERPDDITAIR